MNFKTPEELKTFIQEKFGISTNISTRNSQLIFNDEQDIKKIIDIKLNALAENHMNDAKICEELLDNYCISIPHRYYTPEQHTQEYNLSRKNLQDLSKQIASMYSLDVNAQYELIEKCEDFISAVPSRLNGEGTEGFKKIVNERKRELPKREDIPTKNDDDFTRQIFEDDEPEVTSENPLKDIEQEPLEQPSLSENDTDKESEPFKEDFSEDEPELHYDETEIDTPSHEDIDISNPEQTRALSEDYLKRINSIKSKYTNLLEAPASVAEEVKILQQIRANLKLGQVEEYKANLAKLETIDNSRFLNSNSVKPVRIENFENAYNKTKENLQQLWHTLKNFVVSKTQDLFQDNEKDNR